VAVALSSVTHAANAEEFEAIALDYAAPSGCPKEDAFRKSIEELTAAVRFDPAASRKFTVRIEEKKRVPEKERFAGSLLVREGNAASAPRGVTGATCSEVASALALTVALAVDPEALLGAEPAPSAGKPAASGADEKPSEKPPTPPETEQAREPTRPATLPEWGFELGLLGSVHFGRGPAFATPLGGGSAELIHRVPYRISTRLEVSYARSDSSELSLRWAPSVRLAVCPLFLEPVRSLEVVACAGSEIARLVSEPGVETQAPEGKAVRPFWAVDGRLRVRAVLSPVVVEAFGGAELPLTHFDYRLAATDDVSETTIFAMESKVGALAGIGLAWQIR
jgi:hypothetical protein